MSMIELHPRMVRDVSRSRRLALAGLLARFADGAGEWMCRGGVYLLVRWSGERWPLPSIDPLADRTAIIVGHVRAADAGKLRTYATVAHAVNTIYHYAVVPVSGGGIIGAINPLAITTRTTDGAGATRGAMPNAPSNLDVRLATGNVPVLRWAYSAAGEQTPPATFEVFASSGSAFNFAAPLATVTYRRGQSQYVWSGAALNSGDARWYTVRAKSNGGVLSLIPQQGRCAAGDYDTVSLGHCPKLNVTTGAPPLAANVETEVVG